MDSLKQGPVMTLAQPGAVTVADDYIENTMSIFQNRRGLHHPR